MKLALMPAFVLIMLCGCRTPGGQASLTEVSSVPAKPNDLPNSQIKFVPNDLVALQEHGSSFCKMLEKDKSEDFVQLEKKLCDSDQSWIGYLSADGLKDQNELFIANRIALLDVAARLANAARQKNNIAIQRLVFLEQQLLQQDISIISGDKVKTFENDMENPSGGADIVAKQRKDFAAFTAWPKLLNSYYSKNAK